ncbi:type II secretion system minor pseudopilin GspH [Motilimonas pumila]|uniref:Type II secretion system protein H n=1 Tax=Motilimonas pumila TaxID=2303987 RepID=A0A418YKY1_9GAMM|nr:type II secretion system minor pseudopilin GspH [Motilimonas pumila]RJG51617.1 type II secretion system protein GspH [Motilimonas pumila]
MARSPITQAAGFTLLEIMLVIVLMGLASSAVVMTLPSNGGYKELKHEAQRFSSFVELLNDQALMTSRELGILVDKRTYEFVFYEPKSKKWQPLPRGKFNTKVELPEEMQLELTLSGFAWDQKDEQEELFDEPESAFDEDEEVIEPQLYIMSSGEVTPFKLRFQSAEDKELWLDVDVKVTGALQILEQDEEDA